MGLKVQFDTVVNYMVCGQQYLGKMLGNSSYVDHFDEQQLFDDKHFDEQFFDDQLFDDQHFDQLHFNQHFDVNLEVAKKARKDVEEISEDRRWPRQVWTSLPEKF